MKNLKFFFSFIILLFSCLIKLLYAQPDNPQRIISLGSTLTEELYLLGVEDKLIGVTTYCLRPKTAQKKEKIGTVVEVDLEKILTLKPDLVLATSLTNPKSIEKLQKLGIKVVKFSQPEDFLGICGSFLELARLVGRYEQAQEIIQQTKDKVSLIKNRVKNLSKPRVFVQIGAKPLFTANKDSFIHDFVEFAGGINIAAKAKTGIYSRERVLKQNPDVIIITTMGMMGESEKKIWLKFKSLEAVKLNRIYVVDSYKLCSPTPISFVDTLEELVRLLHDV